MMTFSLNTGLVDESFNYPIVGSSPSVYLDYLLDVLEDNQSKQISAHDLRDTILSVYSSVSFKETSVGSSTYSYIGIDSLNPNDRDVKDTKIYIGKRKYLTQDIMSSSLLNSDVDIFLYNTKSDDVLQNRTRVSLLTGNKFQFLDRSPYIQSQLISGTQTSVSLDFVSRAFGTLNIDSSTGTVSVNNIYFPTKVESSASASNDKVLLYEDGKLAWSELTYPYGDFLGATGTTLNMNGNLFINGYALQFLFEVNTTDAIPLKIGDIEPGEIFQNVSVVDALRRIIYDYLPPKCTIQLLPPYESGYVEVGTFPNPVVQFSITKKSLPTQVASLQNMIPGVFAAITTNGEITSTSTSNGIVISPITDTSTEFKVTVSDGLSTSTASTTITGIYPYFYGFSDLQLMTNVGLGGLSKSVETKSNKTIDLTGEGYYYFIYDYDWGTISTIFDNLGNTVSYTYSDRLFSSPTGFWAGKRFNVYSFTSSQIGPPSENYQFNF
jgi:hypothetical protein